MKARGSTHLNRANHSIRALVLTQTVIFAISYVLVLHSVLPLLSGLVPKPSVLAVRWFLTLGGIFAVVVVVSVVLNVISAMTLLGRKKKWQVGAIWGLFTYCSVGLILTVWNGGPPSDYFTDANALLLGLLMPGSLLSLPIRSVFDIDSFMAFVLPWPAFIIELVCSALLYASLGGVLYTLLAKRWSLRD